MNKLISLLLSLFSKRKTKNEKDPLFKKFDYQAFLKTNALTSAANSNTAMILETPLSKQLGQYIDFNSSDFFNIAANIIHFQNPDGGWGKHGDYTIDYSKTEIKSIYETPSKLYYTRVSSDFDNKCTWGHILYLVQVYNVFPSKDMGKSIEKGIRYIVDSQHENGSWENKNHRHITYNDRVIPGVLGLLLDIIINDNNDYTFLQKISKELNLGKVYRKGIDCILKTQIIRANGKPGIWAQQHDHNSLKPVWGRSYEMPAYATSESVKVIELLQRHQKYFTPATLSELAVSAATEFAVDFLRTLRLPDGSWARFYDLKTEKPIFANRDGTIVHGIEEVDPERRYGYSWFNNAAEDIIRQHMKNIIEI